jgi:hypothetical protein
MPRIEWSFDLSQEQYEMLHRLSNRGGCSLLFTLLKAIHFYLGRICLYCAGDGFESQTEGEPCHHCDGKGTNPKVS